MITFLWLKKKCKSLWFCLPVRHSSVSHLTCPPLNQLSHPAGSPINELNKPLTCAYYVFAWDLCVQLSENTLNQLTFLEGSLCQAPSSEHHWEEGTSGDDRPGVGDGVEGVTSPSVTHWLWHLKQDFIKHCFCARHIHILALIQLKLHDIAAREICFYISQFLCMSHAHTFPQDSGSWAMRRGCWELPPRVARRCHVIRLEKVAPSAVHLAAGGSTAGSSGRGGTLPKVTRSQSLGFTPAASVT